MTGMLLSGSDHPVGADQGGPDAAVYSPEFAA